MAEQKSSTSAEQKEKSASDEHPKPTDKEQDGPSPIAVNLDSFIARIDSLQDTFPLALIAVARARGTTSKKFAEFVQTKTKAGREPNERLIPEEDMPEFWRLRRQIDKASIAERSISRSFVVALISDYDVFLSGLLRILFKIHPKTISTEKTFSYADLSEFSSIDAIQEHMLEKHIEGVLRESHAAQFRWMENKFNLALTKDLDSWPDFVEVTERRNLFVHCDGVVNSQYLSVCKEHSAHGGAAAKGARLEADRKYFTHAHATVFEIAAKLSHVMWRKMLPGDRDDADGHLAGHLMYELLLQERYGLAARMGDFAVKTFKKMASDRHTKMLAVNRAQAHKWLGDESTCLRIVNAEDWSASKDDFRICVAALQNDVYSFIELMRSVGKSGAKPSKKDIRDWPVFREMRKREEVQRAFEDVFGEPINIVPNAEPGGTAPSEAHSQGQVH